MDGFCDLHTHSRFSDGSASPAELVALGVRTGLRTLALTDHNTVSGIPDFLAAAEGTALRAVPGVEISAGWQGREVHIVGLFLPVRRLETVEAFLDRYRRRKAQSNRDLAAALEGAGYRLGPEVLSGTGGTVNRAHIALALRDGGYVPTVAEAFRTLLSPEGPYYRPPEREDAGAVTEFLAELGAVPVLAHPLLSLPRPLAAECAGELKGHGLLALETRYSTYTPEDAAFAAGLAREAGLLESGGSDYHGSAKPEIALGTGTGSLRVPAEWADRLEQAIQRKEGKP